MAPRVYRVVEGSVRCVGCEQPIRTTAYFVQSEINHGKVIEVRESLGPYDMECANEVASRQAAEDPDERSTAVVYGL